MLNEKDKSCPTTLLECIDEFLLYISSVKGFSDNCIKGYKKDLEKLTLSLGSDKIISSVTSEDIRICIGKLSKRKYSVASINRFIAAVRSLFAYCKKFQYIPKNVALEIKTLRMPEHLPRFMTQQEVDELCSLPEKKELLWESRDKAIFEMLYSSGCRVAELASLKLQDFSEDFKSAVVTGKGKKDRYVYFEENARTALKTYLLEKNKRFPSCSVQNIFVNQKGTVLTAHGIWYIVKTYSGVRGTQKAVSPHAFRHTFATAMLSNGADIRVVQEMLGHSSISTTQRYTHVSIEHLKDVYKQAFPHSGKKD